ncbi:hypothetical protein FRB99_003888 [Tulasnella sp. 403]|nr:hypothetical protein FRB99_003888 [Tulasnella sp. 403]
MPSPTASPPLSNDALMTSPRLSSDGPTRPPPSAFRSRSPPANSNPAPTPPPRSPLPALPSASSPLAESDAPLLNFAARAKRASWTTIHTVPPPPASPDSPDNASLSEQTVSDAVLLDTLLKHHNHHILDQWHNKQFGPLTTFGGIRVTDSELGHAGGPQAIELDGRASMNPDVRAILAAYQRDLARQQAFQMPPRPRSRASATGSRRDKKDRRITPPSAPPSAARTPTSPASPRNSIASDLVSLSETSRSLHNLSKRLSHYDNPRHSFEPFDPFEYDRFDDNKDTPSKRSSTQHLPIPPTPDITPRPPILRPPRTAPPASHDLLQKSQDLADKRADLEARRAELLGLPPPPPKPAPTPRSVSALLRRPRKLDLDDSALKPDTFDGTKSTSTARPGIIVRPSTASDSGCATPSPSAQYFQNNDQTPVYSQFSPSSMTFGGDCHRYSRVPSPPPPIPTKDDSLRERSSSPDIRSIIASKERSRSRPRATGGDRTSLETTSSFATGSLRRVSGKIRKDHPASRLSYASSTNSLRMTRNFSYPSDASQDRFPADGVGMSAAGLVEGWPERIVESPADDPGDLSDSSLDLRTPLPAILARAGVLSTRSALIASGASKDGKTKEQKAAELARGIGGKVISKTRLVRHRDGNNLSLGLGLTTGLGWSDSEDEGAPSPLRHHISQIILSKKTSQTSFSSSGLGSRRESVLSSSSTQSRRSSGIARTTNLKGSQSMAQIAPRRPKVPTLSRQPSMTNCPPSAFASSRIKAPPMSQQSSISSIGSILPHSTLSISQSLPNRSPTSSSTSVSSTFTPNTPASSGNNSPLTDSGIGVFTSPPNKPSLGIVAEERRSQEAPSEFGEKVAKPRMGSVAGPSSGKGSVRSRPPPSSFNMASGTPFPDSSGSPTEAVAPVAPRTRKRTTSSGESSIPAPRTRTTSSSSVATTASSALKRKSSMASVRSVAPSLSAMEGAPALPTVSRQNSASSSIGLPPPRVMTVGSLAFPSPPPLSPAVVSMRIAQAQAQAEMRKNGLRPLMTSSLARK